MIAKSCCCYFNVTFEELDSFEIELKERDCFFVDFGEVTFVDHDYHPYPGPYEVTPLAWQDQILATNGKNMEDDVTVFEIPYSEVSNPDGTTVVIAS